MLTARQLAQQQVAPLGALLDALMDRVVEGVADDELACKNDESAHSGPAGPYCGCVRCDIGLIERYVNKARGVGEPPRAIHFGAMAVVDYIAASRGVRRPFRLQGLLRHTAQCAKCRRSRLHRLRHGVKDQHFARSMVSKFLARVEA